MISYGQVLLRHRWKILIWGATSLALFTLVGFFVVPPILKSILTNQLTAALRRDVSIREVRVNPFTLSATLRGLVVKEPKGAETFASLEELYVNLESSSLFRLAAVVKEFRLTKPYIRIVRRQDLSYNFSDLSEGRGSQQGPPGKPPRFSVNNIQITDGGADFADEPTRRTHVVRELNVGIPFISNIPSYVGTFVQPGLSVLINGTRYALQGRTKPFHNSQETTLEVNITDLDLPYYLAYVPQELLTFGLPSGRLDANLSIVFIRQRTTGQALAVKGHLGLRGLAVDDKQGNPVVRIPALGVGLASVEPLVQKVQLGKVSLESLELTVRREKGGITNLETLLPKRASAPPADKKAPSPPGQGLVLDAEEIHIAGAKVLFADLSTTTPFKTTLDPIDVTLLQVSNRPNTRGTYNFAMKTEAKEDLAIEGAMTLVPLMVEGKIEAKSVLLKKYAPYYRDSILFDIESGKLDLSSRYRYAQGEGGPEIVASEATMTLTALQLKRPDETSDFLRIPILAIRNTVADVSQRRLTVGSLSAQKGTLTVKRLPNGELDLQKLTPPAPPPDAQVTPSAGGAQQKPWILTLGRLALDQYTVTLEDRAAAQPISLTADQIQVSAENLSTAKNTAGKLTLALRLDQTGTVSTSAALGLDPLKAEGRLNIAGIALPRYAPYYQKQILFDVQDGTLEIATTYKVAQVKDGLDIKLAGLSSSLQAVRLKARKAAKDFLQLPILAIRNTSLDLTQHEVSIGDLSTERAVIHVARSRDGVVNLLNLLPSVPAAPPQAGPATASPPQAERPWTVKLGTLAASQYSVQVDDAVPAEPVSLLLQEIALKADGLTTQKDEKGRAAFSLRLNTGGTLQVGGTLGISPLVAGLDIAMKDIDIRPLQPYFTDQVKIVITDGRVSASGHLSVTEQGGAGLRATYKGELAVPRFASIDKQKAEDFVRWQSLALTEIDAGYNPFRFRARKVALTDFYARLISRPDGSLNLQEILEHEPEKDPGPAVATAPAGPTSPPSAKPPQGPTDIKIDEVTLQGGRIDFTDRSVRPNFSSSLAEIGGRVSGLSSEEASLADVELRGKFDNTAPLLISGKVNPLRQDLFVDLQARFTGMDLSPATAYSGKYVGYTIEKGKLSFDVRYHISKRKLDSENKVFIDQFTFGEKVDSPTATSLPVRLGVALLKDRNGEIHLDLPVTGSIDDPKFSVWSVILQVLGNLITKAVTSPFALLGAAFGGGEQLQYLEFEYGRAALTEASAKKIEALTTALNAKPSLKLEIAGHVDPEADREGLKEYLLQRKVKAQKLNDLVKKGSPAISVDEITVEPAEYEKYLTLAYRAEKFPKARNIIGMVKSLPVAEMERLILNHIEVGEEEVRLLASQRANAVRAAILRTGKVEGQRLFIVEPKTLAPEKKENLRGSRVEFKIG